MTTLPSLQVTAFEGNRRIASGPLAMVAAKAKAVLDHPATSPVLIFDDHTGVLVELDFRELSAKRQGNDVAAVMEEAAEPRGRGRPKLGVVSREVTLLSRQWDWLNQQRGGASAALRRLVDQARRENAGAETIRQAREALYRFMTIMAGDARGYEEALRALFAGDARRFSRLTSHWEPDVRDHAWRLAPAAFGYPPSPLDGVIPFAKREVVLRACGAAFGAAEIESADRITNGGSGAGVFKINADKIDYLLRIEGPPDGLRDPVRQYACLKIAAEAGVSPRLIYADADNGVAITDFIKTTASPAERSRAELLRQIVSAVKRLHAAPLFPGLISYLDGVDSLISQCQARGILPKRAFEKHLRFYNQLAAAYPRRDSDLVSSHNDLNPGNVLFQAERAWLVDWEGAFAADRYVDIAAVANFFAQNEEELELVLQSYFGAALNEYHRERLFLMRQVNRIFYAMVMLNLAAALRPETRLTATDLKSTKLSELRGQIADLSINESKLAFACALLNEALHDFQSPRFAKAVALVKNRTQRRVPVKFVPRVRKD